MATVTKQNPWQAQGVSILPKEPKDLLPLVGQKQLFTKLKEFRAECVSGTPNKISGFFVLDGAWGVGKSRVGHEICLEALWDDAKWIIDAKPERILTPGFEDKILPLFVRYSQVTLGRFGEELSADNWIAASIVEALQRLSTAHSSSQELGKNQDKLMKWTQQALKPKGWDKAQQELVKVLENGDPVQAAKDGIAVMKKFGIEHLMIVVDEIEDVGDVQRDGLPSDERQGIDQVLLTVIPRVIKSEEIRQVFPDVSFVLLCSLAVGDTLRQIRAIDRRTMRHEIQTNAFSDVQSFFEYLKTERPELADDLNAYPEGLKETAFFASDRNFGWFNVIMSHMHLNHKGSSQPVASLMRQFANKSDAIFDRDAIGTFKIDSGPHASFIEDAMYGLLPKKIGGNEVTEVLAKELLAKRNVEQKPLFARLLEVTPPQDTRIMTHLVNCGFKTEPGVTVYLPGEARFNVKEVMESIKSYSQIAIGSEGRLLICESESEFTAQIQALSAHGEQAGRFAPYLHGLFTDPAYSVKDGDKRSEFLAPSFSFLQEFHKLNRRRHNDEGFLRDGAKNAGLIEAFDLAKKDAAKRVKLLLQGFANAWELESAPVTVESVSECEQTTGITFTPSSNPKKLNPLNLGNDGTCIFVYGSKADDAAIETDLGKIVRRGAVPIVLILEDQDQRVADLVERIQKNVPRVAPFLIVHNVTRHVADYIARMGLMGDVFANGDLRTSQFNAAILDARQHLERNLQTWQQDVAESQGFVIRPLFYGSKITDDDLAAFARGYAAMLSGKSYHDVMQRGNGIFESETQQDAFKKTAERQSDPGPKYADDPRMNLVVDESGLLVAQVPRCLLSVMERCSHVPLKRSEIEKRFLYASPESVKAKDIMRPLTDVMHHLGLIERDGEQIKQTSSHALKSRVEEATNWLSGPFDKSTQRIKRVNQREGEDLVDIQLKRAKLSLRDAANELDELDLSFVKESWLELNKATSDGMPVYEQQLVKSLAVIVRVKNAVTSVFDASANQTFQYSPDFLPEFERNHTSTNYPLWRRVKILEGFYADIDNQRKELIKQIDETIAEVDSRVPLLSDDPYAGQKAFPTLALSRPLAAFRQELDFGADKPNKTVTAGGSSYAIKTVGYKISDHKYQEAQQRLVEIKNELTQPGRIVAGFKELLSGWEKLGERVQSLHSRLTAVEKFFDDAPPMVKQQAGLAAIRKHFESLEYQVAKGGIRQGTEDREEAGAPIFSLVEGLKKDLDEIRANPSFSPTAIEDGLDGLEAQSVQTLEITYQSEHSALVRAWAGVRLANGQESKQWPRQCAASYEKTRNQFEDLVATMRTEGKAYFADAGGTTFQDYVGLCEKELAGKKIDWDAPEYETHITNLKKKKLLELKLR